MSSTLLLLFDLSFKTTDISSYVISTLTQLHRYLKINFKAFL